MEKNLSYDSHHPEDCVRRKVVFEALAFRTV